MLRYNSFYIVLMIYTYIFSHHNPQNPRQIKYHGKLLFSGGYENFINFAVTGHSAKYFTIT